MKNFSSKSISVNDLILDNNNPRFSLYNFTKESSVIKYLFQFEQLQSLVSSILKDGFIEIGERLIVLSENGKYVVLEGNRRVAALKAILNQDENLKQSQRNLSKKFKENVQGDFEIRCDVVESRKMANYKIAAKHISGMREWNPYSKRAFYSNMYDSLIRQGDDSSQAIRSIGETTVEGAAKIRNSIVELRFLNMVYEKTKVNYSLGELPQLDTETVAGRAFSDLKKDLEIKPDRQMQLNIPPKLRRDFDNILALVGELAWVRRRDDQRPLIDTRIIGTHDKWIEFLNSSEGKRLGDAIKVYQRDKTNLDSLTNDSKNEKQSPSQQNPSSRTEDGTTSKDDGEDVSKGKTNHGNDEGIDIGRDTGDGSSINDGQYKLVLNEEKVNIEKKDLPVDLVDLGVYSLYDTNSSLISRGSSEYDNIILKSSEESAPILFKKNKVLKNSNSGTFKVYIAYNGREVSVQLTINKVKPRRIVESNIIYSEEWLSKEINLLHGLENTEKIVNFWEMIKRHNDISDVENRIICASLCRPLLDMTVRLVLQKANSKYDKKSLPTGVNLVKQRFVQDQILMRTESKSLGKVDEDINELNGYLHDPKGVLPVGNLKGIYAKYQLLFEKSFSYLHETS